MEPIKLKPIVCPKCEKRVAYESDDYFVCGCGKAHIIVDPFWGCAVDELLEEYSNDEMAQEILMRVRKRAYEIALEIDHALSPDVRQAV